MNYFGTDLGDTGPGSTVDTGGYGGYSGAGAGEFGRDVTPAWMEQQNTPQPAPQYDQSQAVVAQAMQQLGMPAEGWQPLGQTTSGMGGMSQPYQGFASATLPTATLPTATVPHWSVDNGQGQSPSPAPAQPAQATQQDHYPSLLEIIMQSMSMPKPGQFY